MLSLGIVQASPLKGNAILSGAYGATGELFESVLHELSTGAFRAVVNSGVRDIDAFLKLDTAALDGVSSRIVAELSAVQQRMRQDRHGHSVEHPADPLNIPEYGNDANDTEPTATDDDHLFQIVLDCLGVRAQHTLAYGRIKNLQQFMCLERDVMVGWPNTGAKTIAEILDVQRRVKEFSSSPAHRGPLDADGLSRCLKQPTAGLSKRVGRRSFLDRWVSSTAVEHSADEPAPWSVLRKTISDIFPLDDHELDVLWVSAGERSIGTTIDLPEADWERLAAAAIYKDDGFDVLLAVTLDYLLELQISPEAFDAILSSVASLINTGGHSRRLRLEVLADDKRIVTDADIATIRNFRVDSFNLLEDRIENLYARGIHTWADLGNLTERAILESSGMSLETLRHIRDIWKMKSYAQLADMELSKLPIESYSSFSLMVESFIEPVVKNDRERTIILGRMGIIGGRKTTYDELGQALGLTRARVQQLWQKRASKLKSPVTLNKLARFWFAVFETLKVSGGACLLSELGDGIRQRLAWEQTPELVAVLSLLRLRDEIEVDSRQSMVHNPDVECVGCKTVVSATAVLFEADKDEKTVIEVSESLISVCRQQPECLGKCRYLKFSEGFIRMIAGKTADVMVENGVVYCRETWSARRGSRVQLVEDVLESAGRPMHFSEVYQEVRRLVPHDKRITKHNVHSWLGRTDNILLWDRGTFVHCSNVTVTTDVVASIESWLIERLEDNVPFVSVAGAYAEFGCLCSASGIASESALYSCLRRSANPELCYPRYPQIYLSRNYESRIPAVVALERFIEDAQAEVTYDVLRKYALGDLCLKEFQFQQFIYQLTDIVRTDSGGFLYLNSSSIGQKPESAEDYISSLPRIALEPTFAKLITDVMTAHFSNGFRINSPIELLRFRRFAAEDFGDEISVTDKELVHAIASCGTFSNGKIYVISDEIESRIQDEVGLAISGGAEIVFYSSFYTRHEEWLFAGSVISEEMLKEILVRLYPKYTHKANYFSPRTENGTELSKIRSEIIRIWGSDVILSYKQLSERLPYIPLDKIKSVLAQNGDFVWNATEVYTHICKVDVTDEEYAAISDYVAAACRSVGYSSLSDVPLGEIELRNHELTLTAIHSAVFEIVLADKYNRHGKIITRMGDALDALTIVKEHCRTLDRCSLQDLLDFEWELTGESHRWIPMEAGYAVMVRTDEDTYIAEKYVHFDAAEIDDALDLFVTGEYLPLKSVTTFAAFPHCGQAWNLFVLESYCRRFSDRFRFEVLSANSRNAGAIVRKSCRLSYSQIMADAVTESDVPLEKLAIVEFLCSRGYIGRRSYAKIEELIEQVKVLREGRN